MLRNPIITYKNTLVYPFSIFDYDEIRIREGLFYNLEYQTLAFVFHRWEDLMDKEVVFIPDLPAKTDIAPLKFVTAEITQIPHPWTEIAKKNIREEHWYGTPSGGLYMQKKDFHLYLEPGGSAYAYNRPPMAVFEFENPVEILV